MGNAILMASGIWEFVLDDWGNVASVIGALLTVYFSIMARRAAMDAKAASESARQRMRSIDALDELARLNGRIDDLMFRLEYRAWVVVNERATDLRVSIAAIMSSGKVSFPTELGQRLAEAANQFRIIAAAADRANGGDGDGPDVARYRRIVADQKETLVLAIEEMKAQMERV